VAVTLPLLSPLIFFGTLLTLITSFQVFVQAYVLTGGGPGNASTTLVLDLYDEAFRYLRLGHCRFARHHDSGRDGGHVLATEEVRVL
jgi:ABC-type sugar transport system permease subunit